MENFESFKIPQQLLDALKKMNFETPTPIQAESIPLALEGKDILGCAQTGTGKTMAFTIPMVSKIIEKSVRVGLVITPTRELAAQVAKAIQSVIERHLGITVALLIGGQPMHTQLRQLDRKPQIVVGTPGRINDHLERGTFRVNNVDFLVLDETDRMLDMGFSVQIERIIKTVPKHQTLLFSATLPSNIMSLSKAYLHNPERVSVSDGFNPAKNIEQHLIRVTPNDKYSELVNQLDARTGSVVVFVKTKFGASKLAERLGNQKYKADAIHGDLRHNKRERVIQSFRSKKFRILVATDVAARGLDIPHIEHVINYDLPQCPEDYIHRIGRTARAGAKGEAVCLITKADESKWSAIDQLIKTGKVDQKQVSRGRSGGRSFGGRGGGSGSSSGYGGNSSFGRGNSSFGRGNSSGRSSSSSKSSGGSSFFSKRRKSND